MTSSLLPAPLTAVSIRQGATWSHVVPVPPGEAKRCAAAAAAALLSTAAMDTATTARAIRLRLGIEVSLRRHCDESAEGGRSCFPMDEQLNQLRAPRGGDVLVDGDREYGRARLCFTLLIARRPAVIARCVNSD